MLVEQDILVNQSLSILNSSINKIKSNAINEKIDYKIQSLDKHHLESLEEKYQFLKEENRINEQISSVDSDSKKQQSKVILIYKYLEIHIDIETINPEDGQNNNFIQKATLGEQR